MDAKVYSNLIKTKGTNMLGSLPLLNLLSTRTIYRLSLILFSPAFARGDKNVVGTRNHPSELGLILINSKSTV